MSHSSRATRASAGASTPAFPVEDIARIEAPSPEVFARDYVRPSRPVVLTGLTAGWRPPFAWTIENMAARYGSAEVVAAALADGTLLEDPGTGVVFRYVRLRDFRSSLERGEATDYVMAPVSNFPPSFREDYRVPPYCAGARYLRVKVWLGKGGTVTPLHRDVPHNLHVHLSGRKRWLLFPPGASRRMYSRGLFSGMPNFSEVDPERPDETRHPLFRGVSALGATLGSGETLFIPHGWWHHTRSLDDSVSMNFWWGGALIHLATLASTAYKRLRGIRRGEWG